MEQSNINNLPQHMLYRSHPWHGLSLGKEAPEIINCYIEMVPTDTVKYEIDKETGILKVDRPHRYSSLCPTLYGLLPQTYSGQRVADYCSQKAQLSQVVGDGDPLDICVLTEKTIIRGDLILKAIPIGGLRILDGHEADDKIIAVMADDFFYGNIRDISECPDRLIERIRHYFLTYKDAPNSGLSGKVQITHTYGREEALSIIRLSQLDYADHLQPLIAAKSPLKNCS
jgi:inorganic pyrophosphatase